MRFSFWFRKRPSVFERLVQAEREGPPQGHLGAGEEGSLLLEEGYKTWMTEADNTRYRRILAKLTYGEDDADPANLALLTALERDHLEAYVIQKRWGRFLAQQRGTSIVMVRFDGD